MVGDFLKAMRVLALLLSVPHRAEFIMRVSFRRTVSLLGLFCSVVLVIGGCASSSKKVAAGSPEQDMQAFMAAGMPGEMHSWMAEHAGTWNCNNKMWMAPNTSAMEMTTVATTRMSMDGRYALTEINGQMPGMGEFNGMSTMGFDNVQQKFVATWIDNHASGIMSGVGTLSPDGKRLDLEYTYSCPINKCSTTMREVHMYPDRNTLIMDSFVKDPRTGVEYKCFHLEGKRVS